MVWPRSAGDLSVRDGDGKPAIALLGRRSPRRRARPRDRKVGSRPRTASRKSVVQANRPDLAVVSRAAEPRYPATALAHADCGNGTRSPPLFGASSHAATRASPRAFIGSERTFVSIRINHSKRIGAAGVGSRWMSRSMPANGLASAAKAEPILTRSEGRDSLFENCRAPRPLCFALLASAGASRRGGSLGTDCAR